jgi:hypothetical protein
MTRRLIATCLWAFVLLTGGELAWGLLGAPRLAGPVLAILVAGFVFFDPSHRIWGAPPTRRIARIPDPAVPADATSATRSPFA